MKRLFLVLAVLCVMVFLQSCVSTRSVASGKHTFPKLSSMGGDYTEGLLEVSGTNQAILVFEDRAGREVMRWSEKGQSPVFKVAGKYTTRVYRFRLESGRYDIKIYPYFYQTFPRSRLVELPVRYGHVFVDKKTDTYHKETGRHWGWVSRINTGNKPYRGPKIEVYGNSITNALFQRLLQ